MLAKMLPPRQLKGQRVALFLRANNNLYEAIGSQLISFQYFDIYNDFDDNLEALLVYQPTILAAPPSVLSRLADAIERSDVVLTLTKLVSIAEVLEPTDERRFKQVFNQPMIHQIYQCTEGFLACTCRVGRLHLNEESLIIEREYVDAKHFVPIITDFRRTSQPIIRYRLNDMVLDGDGDGLCPCGMVTRTIAGIVGREDDSFLFRNKHNEEVIVFADMIARCMLYASGFTEYKVQQVQNDHLIVWVDTITAAVKASVSSELRRLAVSQSFVMPRLTFRRYVPDYSKKLKRVERLV
jgi:putative adenylate-forming enzyme